jgi:hypothetical protein
MLRLVSNGNAKLRLRLSEPRLTNIVTLYTIPVAAFGSPTRNFLAYLVAFRLGRANITFGGIDTHIAVRREDVLCSRVGQAVVVAFLGTVLRARAAAACKKNSRRAADAQSTSDFLPSHKVPRSKTPRQIADSDFRKCSHRALQRSWKNTFLETQRVR